MPVFKHEELEDDILHDLIEEINELYEASEQTLIELELTPKDNELQRALFRSVHTIKGDLGLVSFTPMIAILQHLEDLLDLLRKGEIDYTSNMSDLVLLLMDKVKVFVESCMKNGYAEYDEKLNNAVIDVISKINPTNQNRHEFLFANAVNLIDPTRNLEQGEEGFDEVPVRLARTGIPQNLSPEQQVDLLFFRELMKPIEKRIGYQEGRGDRIAKLAFYINELSATPIDEAQLAVACYVHDFGMSFMPADIVNKESALTSLEQNLMRSHVYKSARLLENLSLWDEARKIVMEHHECMDGSGYPLGLKRDQICEGAKLLGILDRYDSLINPKNASKLSKRDAVISLNKDYKGQLSGSWLRLFNQGMTKLLNQ
ncbi:HD domain-containing phosphohydrolase [Alteromonas sp. W364]|uniref:HD-GYP domain-containing protein n=1 Tax=Alteromonas sp. W364 TaxID=3075610 RepID=UPI002885657A|nr:HD domain-containing phosphohydrolase [Alteromonas sp. W364]MDT0629053.1 HD domain-containing phosphohydrolase [Alteromonas sp. W364]